VPVFCYGTFWNTLSVRTRQTILAELDISDASLGELCWNSLGFSGTGGLLSSLREKICALGARNTVVEAHWAAIDPAAREGLLGSLPSEYRKLQWSQLLRVLGPRSTAYARLAAHVVTAAYQSRQRE
jgi:hypothetical protein